MREIIRTILYSWKDRELPEVIDREIDLLGYTGIKPKKIIVITGFRRTGKTYLVFHLIKKLLEKKIKDQVVYINFEDERIPLKTEFLTNLIVEIKQTFRRQMELLFLDEVHVIPEWSKWLRRVYDNENIQIFVTGSSSKMSSREIPTELRGRFLEVKVFPLSFREFLRFKDMCVDVKALKHSENEKAKLIKALSEYLEYGGLPEVVLTREDKKNEILQSYYNTVIRRDIVEKFKIRNEESLKAILRLLLNSTHYTISGLYDNLKGLNYEVGKTTTQSYVSCIEDSYLIYSLPAFSFKIKNQMQHPRRIYFVDNGFINALSTKFSKNIGRLYENAVFMELKRREAKNLNQEIYYWKSVQKEEVDFVIKDGTRIKQLVQVCYDMEDLETKKRETHALVKASKELKCKNLLVITENKEGEEQIKGKRIRFVPLWKWLLGLK